MIGEERITELLPNWEQFLVDRLGASRTMTPVQLFNSSFVTSQLPPEVRADPRHKAMDSTTASEIRSMPDLDFLRVMEIVNEYYGLFLTISDHRKIMAELLAWISNPEVAVDVGSGPCSYLSFLLIEGVISPKCVIGVDASAGAMKRGREITAELEVEVNQCCALAQNLPLAEGCADCVLSIDTIHWSLRWRQCLRQIARITAPEGRIFISHTTGCPRTMGEMTAAEVTQELAQSGINVCDIKRFASEDSKSERSIITGTKGEPTGILIPGTIT